MFLARSRTAFTFTALAIALPGCVALKSTPTSQTDPMPVKPRIGNYYFLPRGLIQLDGGPVTNDFQVTVKTLNVPDSTRRFFLRHRANVFYDDDLQLKVNGKGLLETVNLSTEDRTPAIIDKVTDTIIDIARIQASGFSAAGVRKSSDLAKLIPLKPFHVTFDPFDPAQRKAAIDQLFDCGFTLDFPSAHAAVAAVAPEAKQMVAGRRVRESAVVAEAQEGNGVFYRPPTAVELEITTRATGELLQTGLLQRVWVRLPDPGELALMDASRSFLVKKKNNFTLVDGDLIQVDHNRPSQALALVSIPASIAHKVAEAIPTVIAIQDKRATRVPPELSAQKTQLDAQTAVINSRLTLLETQRKLGQAASGPQSSASTRVLTQKATIEQAAAEELEAEARSERARTSAEQARLDKEVIAKENLADKAEAEARVEKATADKEEAVTKAAQAKAARSQIPAPSVP